VIEERTTAPVAAHSYSCFEGDGDSRRRTTGSPHAFQRTLSRAEESTFTMTTAPTAPDGTNLSGRAQDSGRSTLSEGLNITFELGEHNYDGWRLAVAGVPEWCLPPGDRGTRRQRRLAASAWKGFVIHRRASCGAGSSAAAQPGDARQPIGSDRPGRWLTRYTLLVIKKRCLPMDPADLAGTKWPGCVPKAQR